MEEVEIERHDLDSDPASAAQLRFIVKTIRGEPGIRTRYPKARSAELTITCPRRRLTSLPLPRAVRIISHSLILASNPPAITVPSAAPPPSPKFHLFVPHVGRHLSFGARYLPVHAVQSFAHHLAFCAPRPGTSCGNQDLPRMSAGGHGRE